MTQNYMEVIPILEARGEEVNGFDFYRYIFPNNEYEGENRTDFAKPNAIYLYRDEEDEGRKLRRRIMFNDTWEQDYMDYVECNPMTLCSGLSYRRRANKLDNAQRMNALVIDLDGVGRREIETLFLRFGKPAENIRTLPTPTFLVASGNGVHLYYVFREPIDLYPNIKLQLKALKYALTFRIWDYKSTSQQKAIQYQSINQGFRMVGSLNDKYGTEIRAFRIGDKVTLDDLNPYVRKENRVDINRPFQPSRMTREEAKEAYPEWYQRVVVEGNRRKKKWDIKGKVNGDNPYALYDWWISHADQIRGGHRYYFLMCMVIYACKCDVPKKKLRQDMEIVFETLREVEHENALTKADIESAMETYSKEYYNFTIADIEKLTDVRIERNKRNGRQQEEHLRRARAVQFVDYPEGEWRNKDGRPVGSGTKEQEVKELLKTHPDASLRELARISGMSRNTIRKYLPNS